MQIYDLIPRFFNQAGNNEFIQIEEERASTNPQSKLDQSENEETPIVHLPPEILAIIFEQSGNFRIPLVCKKWRSIWGNCEIFKRQINRLPPKALAIIFEQSGSFVIPFVCQKWRSVWEKELSELVCRQLRAREDAGAFRRRHFSVADPRVGDLIRKVFEGSHLFGELYIFNKVKNDTGDPITLKLLDMDAWLSETAEEMPGFVMIPLRLADLSRRIKRSVKNWIP